MVCNDCQPDRIQITSEKPTQQGGESGLSLSLATPVRDDLDALRWEASVGRALRCMGCVPNGINWSNSAAASINLSFPMVGVESPAATMSSLPEVTGHRSQKKPFLPLVVYVRIFCYRNLTRDECSYS